MLQGNWDVEERPGDIHASYSWGRVGGRPTKVPPHFRPADGPAFLDRTEFFRRSIRPAVGVGLENALGASGRDGNGEFVFVVAHLASHT